VSGCEGKSENSTQCAVMQICDTIMIGHHRSGRMSWPTKLQQSGSAQNNSLFCCLL